MIESELGVDIELEGIVAERRADDFVRAHPSQTEAHCRGECHLTTQGESLNIGATTAEIGVGKAIDNRIRLDVAITEARLPVAEGFEGWLAHLEGENPCGVAPLEGTNASIVDGNTIDRSRVEGDVFGSFANQRKPDRFKVIIIDFPGHR